MYAEVIEIMLSIAIFAVCGTGAAVPSALAVTGRNTRFVSVQPTRARAQKTVLPAAGVLRGAEIYHRSEDDCAHKSTSSSFNENIYGNS